MTVSGNEIVSMAVASQDFLTVARMADASGKVVVVKDNQPAYVLYSMEAQPLVLTEEEIIDVAARRVLKKCRSALMELAK